MTRDHREVSKLWVLESCISYDRFVWRYRLAQYFEMFYRKHFDGETNLLQKILIQIYLSMQDSQVRVSPEIVAMYRLVDPTILFRL